MIVCGIKLTHDGGIAVIRDGVLIFSVEMEKLSNNPRYSGIDDLESICAILAEGGLTADAVDHFVIDGWHGTGPFSTGEAALPVNSAAGMTVLPAAPYHEEELNESILHRWAYHDKLPLAGKLFSYSSYMHVTSHVMSAYATSEAARQQQGAYVLTWDGGQYPRLYYVDAGNNEVHNLGPLFFFLGTIYSVFAQYFGPYRKTTEELADDRRKKSLDGFFGGYSVAGKIMSYIALGKVRPELLDVFARIHATSLVIADDFEHIFSKAVKDELGDVYPDEDILASLHLYIEQLLLTHLEKRVKQFPHFERNLCYAGGCALNIKWNSAIRQSALFSSIWVPPFANDSGSAIGAACSEWFFQSGKAVVEWSVYAGPEIGTEAVMPGWEQEACTMEDLAALLYNTGEPVVFLNGRAELGPRALGNRSIIAPAGSPQMKDLLNDVKHREHFRPVAPICLEQYAELLFEPGGEDPYMLFEHRVRPEWHDRIPAVMHLDMTARVQTVNRHQHPLIFELLSHYHGMSGLPVLCNTSANLNGSGFFPDVKSAMTWGRLNYVWCNGILYSRAQKIKFNLNNIWHEYN
ncbi:hypothetical protein HF324_16155 [Chitinophaga oryzae]|uniref:Carbamoyltransferase n=1 Tax=Chitinophaga oryzae TaxID=2725414 RepID=A0AAE7D957_9BACT|nr:carbamoyltransferase N-terminal domain-containing protein [Chitinophaga oryzae]QJB32853.1 hypothetical protein HF329_16625 [Chitinophaga oryzae]QJB39307.1 hypothetical protein HF324_16155 [Chitinophaga oryzae]